MSYENGFVNIARHREICVAHMTCKGAAHAVYDARVVAKQICCIPRHPSAPRPARLERLPKSLTTLSWLEQAHHELGEGEIQDEREAASAASASSASSAASSASAASASSAASSSPHPASASGQLARFSALARARLPRWPPHLLHHLELVLIARGGVKALAIRAETKLWASTLKSVALSFFAATRRLESTRRSVEEVLRDDVGARDGVFVTHGSYAKPGAIDALRAANRVDRLLNLARGVGPVTLDVADAVARVCRDPAVRWFAAGDAARGTASDFVPSDFKTGALIARHAPVAARWRSEMRATLERAVGDGRWPPSGTRCCTSPVANRADDAADHSAICGCPTARVFGARRNFAPRGFVRFGAGATNPARRRVVGVPRGRFVRTIEGAWRASGGVATRAGCVAATERTSPRSSSPNNPGRCFWTSTGRCAPPNPARIPRVGATRRILIC